MATYRHWQPQDAPQLRPMIFDCLAEARDFKQCYENADLLLAMGLRAAADGQPTLVAVEQDHVIGYTLWVSIQGPFVLRDRVLAGYGTYILREYRRRHIATDLRLIAQEMAVIGGYSRVQGTAYDERGLASVLCVGWRAVGTLVEIDLTKACRAMPDRAGSRLTVACPTESSHT